jgi:hypothetical protein
MARTEGDVSCATKAKPLATLGDVVPIHHTALTVSGFMIAPISLGRIRSAQMSSIAMSTSLASRAATGASGVVIVSALKIHIDQVRN